MAREWVPDFLASLALTPNVSEACRQAGITRKSAYDARKTDAAFAAAWDDALDESTDDLVGEVYRRARVGTEKPVFYQGEECGRVREYSDTLAIFLLKNHRPGVYGDKLAADVTSKGEQIQTVFYIPENGRDPKIDPAPDGPAGDVSGDAG